MVMTKFGVSVNRVKMLSIRRPTARIKINAPERTSKDIRFLQSAFSFRSVLRFHLLFNMHECMHVCACACMCMCVVHMHTRMCTCTQRFIKCAIFPRIGVEEVEAGAPPPQLPTLCADSHTHTHQYTCMYTYTHTCTHTHTLIQAHT